MRLGLHTWNPAEFFFKAHSKHVASTSRERTVDWHVNERLDRTVNNKQGNSPPCPLLIGRQSVHRTPCINRLFLAIVIAIAVAVAPPKISNTAISAANSLAIHVLSSIASNESTPYECTGLSGSMPSLEVDRVCDSFLIRACRAMDPASVIEPALVKRVRKSTKSLEVPGVRTASPRTWYMWRKSGLRIQGASSTPFACRLAGVSMPTTVWHVCVVKMSSAGSQ